MGHTDIHSRLQLVGTRAFAALSLIVVLVVAAQRHQFSRPGLALVPLVIVAVPWVAIGLGAADEVCGRSEVVASMVMAAGIVACTYWLVIGFPEHHNDLAPFLAIIMITFVAASIGMWWGAAVVAGCLASSVGFDLAGHYPFGDWLPWCFAFVIAWLGGAGFRLQMRLTHQLSEAQAELARQATEAERHRLAREVHDLIAHSLAVSMLHLTGARLALQEGERTEALDALREAETAGRAAMAEIHRTVGLLGSSAPEATQAATPSASEIPALIEEFRRAGLAIEYRASGDLSSAPISAGLAAYRIIEESLSNAVKHSPGSPVVVAVTVATTDITLSVTNPVGARLGADGGWTHRAPSGGHGIKGMTERALALGGRLSAGNVDGSWRVEAAIPLL